MSEDLPLLDPSRASVSSLFSWSSMLSDCVTCGEGGKVWRKEAIRDLGNAESTEDGSGRIGKTVQPEPSVSTGAETE